MRSFAFATILAAALVAGGPQVAGAAGPPACVGDCASAVSVPVASPFGITSGPLGSEWFGAGNYVARIDQRGAITTYLVPTPNAGVGWLTTDPSGAVWFAERGPGKVGRITPDGAIVEFALPSPNAIPQGIVLAPDGNVYVTEQGSNAIARLNPSTGAVVDIPVPTPNSTTQSGALGPDGAIWFIERSAAKVGRMTLDGRFTEYPLAPGAFPNRIVQGPDGAMWFTELRANKIGRITMGGDLSEFPVAGGPVGITAGKDGQLYTVLFGAGAVARMDLQGAVTGEWQLSGARGVLQLSTGSGLDIWVADAFGHTIFRVTPYRLGR